MLTVVHDAEEANGNEAGRRSLLDEIVRDDARQMLAAAMQAEVAAYIDFHAHEVDDDGRRLVVRNGHHQPREVLTAAGLRNLAVLTGHRGDLIADRVRTINRLRDLMTSVFPSLGREFDYKSCKGAVVLLTGYASLDRIRRIGQARLSAWLQHRRVRDYAGVAARAVVAARAQMIVPPDQDLAAAIISELATNILALDERVKALDAEIATIFEQHPQAAIIASMSGFGPIVPAGRCRRSDGVPERWAPRRGRRARPGPQRLRAQNGQPAQTTPLYPAAATRVLPVGADQHDPARTQPGLLPEKAWPNAHPQPGRHRPCPAPHRRPLGTAAREPNLDCCTATNASSGLTTPLRFPMPRNRAVLDLGRSVNDGDHRLTEPRSPLRRVAARLTGHPSRSDRAHDSRFNAPLPCR